MSLPSHSYRLSWIFLFLALLTTTTFWKVRECDFINLDDPLFVTENIHIASGLTPESSQWCITADLFEDTPRVDYWQPVTFLARALIISLFGLNPAMHHSVNLVLHIVNVLLLFHVLRRMTGATLRCALVAALWAIHPQRVESVAWVTEIKDLLSGFFWLMALWAYLRYVAHPGWKRYLPMTLLFALGLMSKPMVVTFPIILLVLDFWPLNRASLRKEDLARWIKLSIEKAPLFFLSLGSGLLTLRAGHTELHSNAHLHPLVNIILSYGTYLQKTIWPYPLYLPYPPLEQDISLFNMAASALLLGGISLALFRKRQTHPGLLTGWAWFLMTLTPVVGMNSLATADRFTYIPAIGLNLFLVWFLTDAWTSLSKPLRTTLTASLLFLLALLCFRQTLFWRNSKLLFSHSIQMSQHNATAQLCLGNVLLEEGDVNGAIQNLSEAIAIKDNWGGHNSAYVVGCRNLAVALAEKGQYIRAAQELSKVIALDPNNPMNHYNLGIIFMRQHKQAEAIIQLEKALLLNPDFDLAIKALRKLGMEPPPS